MTDHGSGPGAGGNDASAPAIDYLRMSVTDRCNLRCVYCMPENGVTALRHRDIMSYEELLLFAQAAFDAGLRRIRLTGGEPLARKGIVSFVEMLASIDPGLHLSLTTNGVELGRLAGDLREAGLRRVNVSIDSLDPETYREISRVGSLESALSGLRAAVDAGLEPVKVNVVILKGLNDDPRPFAALTRELPVHVRFIEYMPYFGESDGRWYVPADVVRRRVESVGTLEEDPADFEGWGPASYYRLKGAPGTIGFISPVSCHFCPSCNRVRISAEGRMRTCLFDGDGVDVRSAIRGGTGRGELTGLIRSELARKAREGHRKPVPGGRVGDHMSRIGG